MSFSSIFDYHILQPTQPTAATNGDHTLRFWQAYFLLRGP